MIGFIVGLLVGGFFGFTVAAIMVVCHDSEERERKLYDEDSYQKGDEMR